MAFERYYQFMTCYVKELITIQHKPQAVIHRADFYIYILGIARVSCQKL